MEEPVRNGSGSVSTKVMMEAIELAIEGDSPYPHRAIFVDADASHAGMEVLRATDQGIPVVLVSGDGTSRVIEPGSKVESREVLVSKRAA